MPCPATMPRRSDHAGTSVGDTARRAIPIRPILVEITTARMRYLVERCRMAQPVGNGAGYGEVSTRTAAVQAETAICPGMTTH